MFAQSIRGLSQISFTENGAIARRTTGSALLDFYGTIGASRTKQDGEIIIEFEKAFSENRLLALKTIFYARNVRGGLGERRAVRVLLNHIATNYPDVICENIALIPHFGRWDDLYCLVGTAAESAMWGLIRWQWHDDIRAYDKNEPISLMAKWLKSVNTSSKDSCILGRLTAKNLYLTEKSYRKGLSMFRARIDVVERKMSANGWQKINYPSVPSIAMKNYRNAFKRHDGAGFEKFIESVQSGDEKINSGTLYPYDILHAANLSHYRTFQIQNDPVLEEQWRALPNYVSGNQNIIIMADTSGSMNGQPMETSIGLAIYFAERNIGAYHNLFMTFSESPSYVEIKGKTLAEKVACVPSIVANTDIEKAFMLILQTALDDEVPEVEMPAALVIISDMQFDAAQNYYNRYTDTMHDKMAELFERNGYALPHIVYWNVEDRRATYQAKSDTKGVSLASGHSTSVFKSLVTSIGKTPYESMLDVLNAPEYDIVKLPA
jgi:hypothetical protein